MAEIIDGKAIAQKVKLETAQEVKALKQQGVEPTIAVVLVGDNQASKVYVRNKMRACEQTGVRPVKCELPGTVSQQELLELIGELAVREDIHGILVQLPLPQQIDEQAVLQAIPPEKDVDGFHPQNVGRLLTGGHSLVPCTPAGILRLLEEMEIDLAGKHCVVVGRSNIVGKPAAILMLRKDATVTICHSKTVDLAEQTRRADILIAAVGRPKFITADMVKEGAVIIDVGMDRDENNRLCGDVDFDGVQEKCSAITPVPGGVGPMTVAMLMRNTVFAASMQAKKRG